MIIQKISQNLKSDKLISLYNVLFIFKCFHDEQHTHWCKKKIIECTEPESHQMAKTSWKQVWQYEPRS